MMMKVSTLIAFLAALSTADASPTGTVVEVVEATCLNQGDFEKGTKIITAPGTYKLCEDIVFSPNESLVGNLPTEESFDPDFDVYDRNAFGLGFFAAIAIATSDVTLDLNGKTIQHSDGHALFQRFFAVIELADAPFIKSAGPAQFVGDSSTFQAASNIKILGPGTIGQSSHHGIHGNENSNVLIKDVTFTDFEVAAVSLNNVDSLTIENCEILQNRHDVPVVGMFSAARFIKPYGKKLSDENFSMNLRGKRVSAKNTYKALVTAINNVYDDVVNGNGRIDQTQHPDEYQLFDNRFQTVDGPCYAFVVHGKGPAVNGFGDVFSDDSTATSSDVVLKNNTVNNIKCWTNEIPAVVEDGKVVNDARGAVFQFVSSFDNSPIAMNDDGTYKGNVVSDMQIMVAHAINEGILVDTPELQTGVNSINDAIINWAGSGTDVYTPAYRCNGDSMHHVSKGMVMIRVEDTKGFDIQDNSISGIENLSPPPFSPPGGCASYHVAASAENLAEQQSGNCRVISVAAVRGYDADKNGVAAKSTIASNTIGTTSSDNPNIIVGIDVQGDSESVVVRDNVVDLGDGDKTVGLRVREFTDGQGSNQISVSNNDLAQGQQILNRRKLRNLPVLQGHEGIEWQLGGGCPFANANKK